MSIATEVEPLPQLSAGGDYQQDKNGELGNGSLGSSPIPVKVAGNYSYVSIGDVTDDHFCAIATRQASRGAVLGAAVDVQPGGRDGVHEDFKRGEEMGSGSAQC